MRIGFRAEALVEAGKGAEARQALTGLPASSKAFSIIPLALLAQRQLTSAPAEARQSLDAAYADSAALPKEGRGALDAAGTLAATLARAGRLEEAQKLATAHNDGHLGPLSLLWRGTVGSNEFRFDKLSARPSLASAPHPQWASVTLQLAQQGAAAAAQAWIAAAPSQPVRDNCAAVLATELAARGASLEAVTKELEGLAGTLQPAGQLSVWAGAGCGRLEAGDRPGAEAAAAKARAVLAGVLPGTELSLPAMKEMYDLGQTEGRGLPEMSATLSLALGAADLAVLEMRLGNTDAAMSIARTVHDHLKSIAPSANATGEALDAVVDRSRNLVTRKELAEILGIEEARIFARFSDYEKQVRAWHDRALTRLDLETDLLERLARAGAVRQVWELITSAIDAGEGAQPYEQTTLPPLLRELAVTAGDAALASTIETSGKYTTRVRGGDLMAEEIERLPVEGGLSPAFLGRLRAFYGSADASESQRVDIAILNRTQRLLEEKPEQALEFAASLPDTQTLVREDAIWLIGARSVRNKSATSLLKLFDSRAAATNSIAFYRGLMSGVAAK
ncbi:MAG: hypothetical protein R3B90_04815 [Planctomycetaceae bacterium]